MEEGELFTHHYAYFPGGYKTRDKIRYKKQSKASVLSSERHHFRSLFVFKQLQKRAFRCFLRGF